jgi:hypothetical protein
MKFLLALGIFGTLSSSVIASERFEDEILNH